MISKSLHFEWILKILEATVHGYLIIWISFYRVFDFSWAMIDGIEEDKWQMKGDLWLKNYRSGVVKLIGSSFSPWTECLERKKKCSHLGQWHLHNLTSDKYIAKRTPFCKNNRQEGTIVIMQKSSQRWRTINTKTDPSCFHFLSTSLTFELIKKQWFSLTWWKKIK